MSIVFHFDGTEALRKKVEAHGVTLCPKSDDAAFARLLPEVEVLWHVLKPVTADLIALPPTHPLLALTNVRSGTSVCCRAESRCFIAWCSHSPYRP